MGDEYTENREENEIVDFDNMRKSVSFRKTPVELTAPAKYVDDEYGVESAPESSSDKEEVSLSDISARKPINNQGSCWIYFVQQIFYQNCKHGTDHFICFSIAYRIEMNRKL
ncbi:unnamed protein product [Schistosoma mattheei]|uniref:Uncharacterized protein n=1 Tax=Schistosoma mattheei TaxID=31246 RepID=A0A3P8FRQ7_9TREM|nr:unnamed protein product [Schistosoma mattheei]